MMPRGIINRARALVLRTRGLGLGTGYGPSRARTPLVGPGRPLTVIGPGRPFRNHWTGGEVREVPPSRAEPPVPELGQKGLLALLAGHSPPALGFIS